MASSRWKRFAFFERHTLSLSPEVLNDLIPIQNSGDGIRHSMRTLDRLGKEATTNDSVHLVVTTASLPLNSKPSTLASPLLSLQENEDEQQQQQDSLMEMWSSLYACTGPDDLLADIGSSGGDNDDNNNNNKKNDLMDFIRLPSQMQQSNTIANEKASSSTTTAAAATATTTIEAASMNGLVLVFLSSRSTGFVHCLDVTVRCNPPPSQQTTTTTTTPPQITTTTPQRKQQPHKTPPAAEKERELEDLDGWRGYFAPFGGGGGKDGDKMDGIHGIAVCRSASNNNSIQIACISQSDVCVWEDPHLYLSCRKPFKEAPAQTTTTRTGTKYTLLSPWNILKDGRPCAVDIVPGLVAVGTDTGAVLVYLFGTTTTTTTTASSGAAAGAPTVGTKQRTSLRQYLSIPPPPAQGMEVVSVRLSLSAQKAGVFVAYRRRSTMPSSGGGGMIDPSPSTVVGSSAGISCYEMPLPRPNSPSLSAPSARHDLDGRHVSSNSLCDSVANNNNNNGVLFTVARPDGLYTYSQTQKVGVAPIDGSKHSICFVPPPTTLAGTTTTTTTESPSPRAGRREASSANSNNNSGVAVNSAATSYVLVASTDTKSDRDAVDIYDASNKLVAFHLLLSPGHKALQSMGCTAPAASAMMDYAAGYNGSSRGSGRSSAVVLTSGGHLITLTEKGTAEKVSLLVQKNLYQAAIVVASSDPAYEPADITALYRKHAEYLYRKGDYGAAVDQYIHTIGSLESSHVIFRFLGAPKIPLLVKYLEELRSRELATPVHNELLKTCYLKLNDSKSAESIATTTSATTSTTAVPKQQQQQSSSTSSGGGTMDTETISSILADNPRDALATICSLEAPRAAEALITHGAALARALPRETAGVVVSLCVGTYSTQNLADAAHAAAAAEAQKMLVEPPPQQPSQAADNATATTTTTCEPYPLHLFAAAFLENPKMLRLIIAHCNRQRCPLTPSLRRTLLELTLDEWNQAKRAGDTEIEKLRHKEAFMALTDSFCRHIGDYDALVICQQAGFDEGELLLYERLQMAPMLLQRYAKDGSEKSRRQMLAMCQTDPEILADVLGHFVAIASERLDENPNEILDDDSEDGASEILEDIRETLSLARRQGVLPPVRIARILAGEGTEQFSGGNAGGGGDNKNNNKNSTATTTSSTTNTSDGGYNNPLQNQQQRTVPLSVALDYVGAILDESRKEISRLQSEVEEYNQLCNSMEAEAAALLRTSNPMSSSSSTTNPFSPFEETKQQQNFSRINIDEMYSKVRLSMEEGGGNEQMMDIRSPGGEQSREAFWREMDQSEDSFETIARFFAKGVIQ